jgi:hypothetical protein
MCGSLRQEHQITLAAQRTHGMGTVKANEGMHHAGLLQSMSPHNDCVVRPVCCPPISQQEGAELLRHALQFTPKNMRCSSQQQTSQPWMLQAHTT